MLFFLRDFLDVTQQGPPHPPPHLHLGSSIRSEGDACVMSVAEEGIHLGRRRKKEMMGEKILVLLLCYFHTLSS